MIRTAVRARTLEWAEEETSRICEIVMNSNYGIQQQIITGRTDLMDILTPLQLAEADDIGVTPAYQAVYYDKPDIIEYLNKRHVDLGVPCDPAGYGNPMFYAVSMNKYRVVEMLDRIGYSVNNPCDMLGQLPIAHALRIGNSKMVELIQRLQVRHIKYAEMFRKNYFRYKHRRKYLRIKRSIILLQSAIRGFLTRKRIQKYNKH